MLGAAGFCVAGGTDLFRLIEDRRAGALYEHLARRSILTRPFADRPDRLRIGLPGRRGEARLGAALATFPDGTAESAPAAETAPPSGA
jgi:cobalamin biosynthetic protein CobC